jgi:hypothetical protein
MAYKKQELVEVFKETKLSQLEEANEGKFPTIRGQKSYLEAPRLPEYYNTLTQEGKDKVLSKVNWYSKLQKFTPYLIQNLLYISATSESSTRDKIQATKILIDKIMPSLEAQHIQLDNNVQGLVIVKSSSDKHKGDDKNVEVTDQ